MRVGRWLVDLPHQREPRAYGVGARARRFAPSGPELRNPRHAVALVVLLRSCVQGPVRVIQVGPAQGNQVSASGQQDGVRVVVCGDGSHRNNGDARRYRDFLPDSVRVGRLVAAAELPASLPWRSGPVETSMPSAPWAANASSDADSVVRSCRPSIQSVAEIRTVSGLSAATSRADGVEDLKREAEPVFHAAAVFVGALVGHRGEEGGEKVAVRGMHFRAGRSRRLAPGGRRRRSPSRPCPSRPGAISAGNLVVRSRRAAREGPTTSQLPDSSGSSMPSHISLVDALRPAVADLRRRSWPSECPWTNSTMRLPRRRAGRPCTVPVQPGVMRPSPKRTPSRS